MKKIIKLAIFTFVLTLAANVAFAQTPTTADGWYRLGNSQYKQKQYQAAINSYTECIRLLPQASHCYNNRGFAYTGLKNYKSAISDFTATIRINPNFAKVNYYRGNSYLMHSYSYREYEYLRKANLLLAVNDYTIHIKSEPNFVEAFMNRGIANNELKNLYSALNDFSKVISLNPNHLNAHISRGKVLYKLNNKNSALDDLSRAIQIDSRNAEPYFLRSLIYCEQGKVSLATADEQRAIQLGWKITDPCTANANQNLGNSSQHSPTQQQIDLSNQKGYMESKLIAALIRNKSRSEGDKIILDKLNALLDKDVYAGFMAWVFLEIESDRRLDLYLTFRGRKGEAMPKLRAYEKIRATNFKKGIPAPPYPKGVPLPGTSWDSSASEDSQNSGSSSQNANNPSLKTEDEWRKIGEELMKKVDYREIIRTMSEAIKSYPSNPSFYEMRANANYSLKNYQAAINDYSALIRLSPDNSFAYSMRGAAHGELKNFQAAIGDLTKAISASNSHYRNYLHLNRSKIYCKAGKVALAKADEKLYVEKGGKLFWTCSDKPNRNYNDVSTLFEKVSTENSQNTDSRQDITETPAFRAKSLYLKKDYAGAIKLYNEAIKADGDNAKLYLERGRAFEANGQADQALSDYRTALLKAKKDSSEKLKANFEIAKIYYNKGNYREALKYADQSLTIAGKPLDKFYFLTDNGWFYHLELRGNIYFELGQYQKAIDDLVTAKEESKIPLLEISSFSIVFKESEKNLNESYCKLGKKECKKK